MKTYKSKHTLMLYALNLSQRIASSTHSTWASLEVLLVEREVGVDGAINGKLVESILIAIERINDCWS